jgi:hypothetical protein
MGKCRPPVKCPLVARSRTPRERHDARWNNLSGLPPCYQCNLMEMSNAGGNTWERNPGTLNLTDACLF